MAENSKIEWTDHTFNPWLGCTKVSDGCKHCYAETLMDKRYEYVRWGPQGTRRRTSAANWRKPLQWDKQAKAEGRRYRVFCASLADVFEDNPQVEEWRFDLWDLIEATPNLDWLLLTKRPENVLKMVPNRWLENWPDNAWVGTSIENQEHADKRIPHLLRIPAVRFLSCEPLLGPIDLYGYIGTELQLSDYDFDIGDGIDWVIVGGESGPGARLMQLNWALDIVRQCQDAGVAVFVKQLGSNPAKRILEPLKVGDWQNKQPIITPLKLKDKKGGDMSEWPTELQIREFPVSHSSF